MLKFIYFTSCCVFFIIALFIFPCTSFTCVHDRPDFPKTSSYITRSVKYHDFTLERDTNESLFEPLKVHFYLDNFDPSVATNAIFNIERASERVADFIEKTFQVRNRDKPFLLARQGCIKRWASGENKGKCSKVKSEPEICSTAGIDYPIPDRYLDKQEVYDYEGSKPRYANSPGAGLLDANFVAFLNIEASNFCDGTDVSAYGTYCRYDPLTNEPLAGIINFCPEYFSTSVYSPKHYYDVILHEMFHVLGFSSHLFEKYLPCQKGIYCDVPKSVILEDSQGTPRMMFPLVIKNMQSHFSCSKSDYGGPMEVDVPKNNKTGVGSTSHWDPLLMYSSIMIPTFDEFDHLFVDNITLAVFASTGWYRMNFSNADVFRFGKGQGCDFGINSSCDNSIFLCNPSLNKTGCDLAHKTIGQCEKLTERHPCGVFKPFRMEECESSTDKEYGLDFYSLGFLHKCFMIYENDTSIIPKCLRVKCRTEATYSIMIGKAWYMCSFRKSVEADGVTIHCPDSFLFCKNVPPTAPRDFCPKEKSFFIAVRMYFQSPSFDDLYIYRSFKRFKVTTLRGIAENLNIPVNYMSNSSLTVFKTLFLDFSICPPRSVSLSRLSGIVDRVQKFLDGSKYLSILKGAEDMVISSQDIKIDPTDALAFTDQEGFQTLLIFPVLGAIFLVATIVASIVRWIVISKHKPKRVVIPIPVKEETVVRENILLTTYK